MLLRIDKGWDFLQNRGVMSALIFRFSLLASACFLAAAPLQAALRATVHDASSQTDVLTYSLPSGWKSSGGVVRDGDAASPVNRCVRTMQLIKENEDITAHHISAWEVPLKKRTPHAQELADALLPAVCLLPGYTIGKLVCSQLAPAPKEVQDFRLGRDRLRKSLGEHISGRVHLLSATYMATKQGGMENHNVIVGAVVHERTIRTGFRIITTASFHDITIIGGPVLQRLGTDCQGAKAQELEKALKELSGIAQSARFNRKWLRDYLRDTAASYDGMPKVDEKILPLLEQKAEAGLKLGFPAVVEVMRALYEPVYDLP